MIKFTVFLFSTIFFQSVISCYLWNLLNNRDYALDLICDESKNATGIIVIVGLLYNSITVLLVSIFLLFDIYNVFNN